MISGTNRIIANNVFLYNIFRQDYQNGPAHLEAERTGSQFAIIKTDNWGSCGYLMMTTLALWWTIIEEREKTFGGASVAMTISAAVWLEWILAAC